MYKQNCTGKMKLKRNVGKFTSMLKDESEYS